MGKILDFIANNAVERNKTQALPINKAFCLWEKEGYQQKTPNFILYLLKEIN